MAVACFVAMACHVASAVIIDVTAHEATHVACFVAVAYHVASAKFINFQGTPINVNVVNQDRCQIRKWGFCGFHRDFALNQALKNV